MAETVYKSIPDLDVLTGSLDGFETLPVVKSGKTYRRSWTNFFGSGWMAQLLQAFSSFVAPNATHADDADTVGGDDKAALHNAANLTGAVPLASIPAQLTGKNAANATAWNGFLIKKISAKKTFTSNADSMVIPHGIQDNTKILFACGRITSFNGVINFTPVPDYNDTSGSGKMMLYVGVSGANITIQKPSGVMSPFTTGESSIDIFVFYLP